jgi:hypothetical protein
MSTVALSRYAPGFTIAAALVAGCGGSQPIGAPGVVTQTSVLALGADRGKSWMLPEAKSDDLLYVSDGGAYVYVFSYPGLKPVHRLSVPKPEGLCSDSKGDVFVTAWNDDHPEILEYAHGAMSPMQTLQDTGYDPTGCAVDATTGDLAVANSPAGNLAVYKSASGTPATYTSPDFSEIDYCGYDDRGNLFIDGEDQQGYLVSLGELPKGKKHIVTLRLKEDTGLPGEVQWDGQYVTLANPSNSVLYRLKVAGLSVKVVSATSLRGYQAHLVQSWIQGGTIMAQYGEEPTQLGLWQYPRGGKPTRILAKVFHAKSPYLPGVTVSVAP